MFDALKGPVSFDDDDWPKNKSGRPKLLMGDAQADDAIKAGLLTEDDIVRVQPIKTATSEWSGFRFIDDGA